MSSTAFAPVPDGMTPDVAAMNQGFEELARSDVARNVVIFDEAAAAYGWLPG